ncbi:hypothetical protein, partial [Oribacterium sp. oral taxon 078]|uniref:hypothetical protein n=1 Tax=Oribacterium sp. oral taxon 078 TaxID=652706 RepID=UPI001A97F3A1
TKSLSAGAADGPLIGGQSARSAAKIASFSSLPSGRLGAFLSLLEEKCLPKGGRLNRVYIVCFT